MGIGGYCMYIGENAMSLYVMILVIWVRLFHMEFNDK